MEGLSSNAQYTLADSSCLTYSYILPLYKEAAGNLGFSKQQYVSASALFRPACWSGWETAVFAQRIYNRHISDAEHTLPMTR